MLVDWLEMRKQALEAARKLRIPLLRIMVAGAGVKLIGESAVFEKCGKTPVRFEQNLLFAGGQVDVRCCCRIG
jgi:hypothetical protein